MTTVTVTINDRKRPDEEGVKVDVPSKLFDEMVTLKNMIGDVESMGADMSAIEVPVDKRHLPKDTLETIIGLYNETAKLDDLTKQQMVKLLISTDYLEYKKLFDECISHVVKQLSNQDITVEEMREILAPPEFVGRVNLCTTRNLREAVKSGKLDPPQYIRDALDRIEPYEEQLYHIWEDFNKKDKEQEQATEQALDPSLYDDLEFIKEYKEEVEDQIALTPEQLKKCHEDSAPTEEDHKVFREKLKEICIENQKKAAEASA